MGMAILMGRSRESKTGRVTSWKTPLPPAMNFKPDLVSVYTQIVF